MQTGGELAKHLWQTTIRNVESYLDDGVRAGTVKPSRDPAARARYLAMAGGGAFLLYLQLHDNPTDVRTVLRDYGNDMMMPALEVFTEGLLADYRNLGNLCGTRPTSVPTSEGEGNGSDTGDPTH